MKWHNFSAHAGVLLFLAAGFSACTKTPRGTTPEAAVEAYVKTAFSAHSTDDLKTMIGMSTGEALDWLNSMTAETFQQQFVNNKMVLQSLVTKDVRHETDGDVSLVYEIAFKDGSNDGKPTAQAIYTNKKIAYLHKDGDQWKIKATKNVKTVIERKDPLEILAGPAGAESVDEKPETKKK